MKVQIGGVLHEIKECPVCGRTVFVGNIPATGFIARCGRRLANVEDFNIENETCRDDEAKEQAMGDDLVSDVHETLEDVAFANGIEMPALHPVVDVVVNRLRRAGLDDNTIRLALVTEE